MAKRKVSLASGAGKDDPNLRSARLSTKPAPGKVEGKPPKKGKDKPSAKNVQAKRKGGAKGKQAEVTKPETKEDLPVENGEAKSEESPASEEAGEEDAKAE